MHEELHSSGNWPRQQEEVEAHPLLLVDGQMPRERLHLGAESPRGMWRRPPLACGDPLL